MDAYIYYQIMNKLSPLKLKLLVSLFAMPADCHENPNYLGGKELVDLFDYLGYEDTYENGITTPDLGINTSRTKYAKARLKDINEKGRIDEAIDALINNIKEPDKLKREIENIIGSSLKKDTIQTKRPINTRKKEIGSEENVVVDIRTSSSRPKVFVVYSHDNTNHEKWVQDLTENLRIKAGVNAIVDKYISLDDVSFPQFMKDNIISSNYIIMIGTPQYKERFDKLKGGVGTEAKIMQNLNSQDPDINFVIPVLREGSFQMSFPIEFSANPGVDFTSDDDYDKKLDEVGKLIWNNRIMEPVAIGEIPSYVKIPSQFLSNDEVQKSKDYIILDDLFSHFNCYIMDEYLQGKGPEYIHVDIIASFDYWESYIRSSTFNINDAQLMNLMRLFFDEWKQIINYGYRHYVPAKNLQYYHFNALQCDIILDSNESKAFEELNEMIMKLEESYKNLCDYVKQQYHIDLKDTSLRSIKNLAI